MHARLLLKIKNADNFAFGRSDSNSRGFYHWSFKSEVGGLQLGKTEMDVCTVQERDEGLSLDTVLTIRPYDIAIHKHPVNWPGEKSPVWDGFMKQKLVVEIIRNIVHINACSARTSIQPTSNFSSVLATINSASQHIQANSHCTFSDACNLWDLDKQDLDGIDLSTQNMEKANLLGARLTKANLTHANLRGADMIFCSLRGANLDSATLAEALLPKAQMSGASLRNANCQGATLAGAVMTNANLENTDFSYADCHRTVFYDANIRNTDLSHANLQSAGFCGANLVSAIFSNANITDAAYNGATANEHTARLLGIDYQPTDQPGIVTLR